nr:hypothetical protein [Tanacetum cinerariifolium]
MIIVVMEMITLIMTICSPPLTGIQTPKHATVWCSAAYRAHNEEIRNSNAYKEYYAITTGAAPPKPKASVKRTRSSSDTSITPSTAAASLRLTASAKGKQTAKASKAKSLSALSEVAMTEAQQLKLVTKKSMQQTHISKPSGSGAYEEIGSIPGIPDVPTDESEEEPSWNSTDNEGDVDERKDGDDDEEDVGDDGEEGDGDDDDEDDDGDEGGDEDQEYDEEEYAKETRDEESFDPIPQTPEDSKDEGDGEEDLGLIVGEEERHVEEEEEDELYRDVNINQGRGIQATLKAKDSYVTLTPVNPDGQQQSSSVSSQFVMSMLNPTLDVGMESIFETTSQMDVQPPTSFAGAVSAILGIVQRYMDQRMNEAVKVAVQIQSDRLRNEAQRENDEFLKTVDENMKKIIKEQVKDQVKMELKKILIEKMKGNKSIQRSDEQRNLYKVLVEAYKSDKIILDTYGDTVTLKRRQDDDDDKDKEPSAGPDRGSKRRIEGKEPESASAPTETATKSTGRLPFRWKSPHIRSLTQVDTLTLKLLAGPTYELMKGSCKSLIDLEYHLKEVFKATTDQLDWVNPEGQQYPHNLLKPLPLKPNNRGRRVISFEHFINNDLEYLRRGASSQSARDVYSKRRIITVTELKIVEWHSYKHLDWIMMRRDDDKLYKFKEGIFKRLPIQDIEDMLLLLVQENLTNLTVEEHFAFNVSLQMFTRRSSSRGVWKTFNWNKDKKNRLMRIDELHKFSDGTLTDVRTALDDRLKGIQM